MKVSIVTICYNNESGLKRTMDSVRRQTFKDYEYIVIDGSSTDGSVDVIKDNQDIVSAWVSEPDSGVYNAMNKSLAYCNGDYVIFLNSGDCFYDDNVLTNVFLGHQAADVLYGDVMFEKVSYANRNIQSLQDFYCKSPFCHQSSFTKLEILKKYRFREDYKIVSDWILFTEAFLEGASYHYVPYIVSNCENGGVSSDLYVNNIERRRYLENALTPKITCDYEELLKIKNGVLFNLFQRLEKTKKLKYYIYSILRFSKVKF